MFSRFNKKSSDNMSAELKVLQNMEQVMKQTNEGTAKQPIVIDHVDHTGESYLPCHPKSFVSSACFGYLVIGIFKIYCETTI